MFTQLKNILRVHATNSFCYGTKNCEIYCGIKTDYWSFGTVTTLDCSIGYVTNCKFDIVNLKSKEKSGILNLINMTFFFSYAWNFSLCLFWCFYKKCCIIQVVNIPFIVTVFTGWAEPKQPCQQPGSSAVSGKQERVWEARVGHCGTELAWLLTLLTVHIRTIVCLANKRKTTLQRIKYNTSCFESFSTYSVELSVL